MHIVRHNNIQYNDNGNVYMNNNDNIIKTLCSS